MRNSAKVLSIINWKGGVGKTTCAVNIAAEWAYSGKNVLLIDIDAQASASAYIYTEEKYKDEYFNPIAKALKSRREEQTAKNIAITKSIFGIFWDAIKDDMQFSKENGIKRSLADLYTLDLIPSTFYLNELETVQIYFNSPFYQAHMEEDHCKLLFIFILMLSYFY
ncbi:MAG: ParA family protein [Candidatus Thorarchaeota archaeon]